MRDVVWEYRGTQSESNRSGMRSYKGGGNAVQFSSM
jgi:hypothetical protein